MKGKKIALTAVVIVLYVLLIGVAMLMILTGKALYLSGRFVSEYALGFGFFAVLILVHIIIKCVGFFGKGGDDAEERGAFDIVILIISVVMLVLAVLGFIGQVGKAENERLDLPDGNTVLLNEKVSAANETVAVDVYKINGIIAQKIGEISDEDILMDNFLEESGWDHAYDEDEKILTIYCLLLFEDEEAEEGYSLGIWEESFALE